MLGTAKLFSGEATGMIVQLPGWQYPAVIDTGTGQIHFDNFEGAGRHRGRLGELLVQLANGVRCAVGTGLSDAERISPPPIGTTITFRYQGLSDAGVPRFPSYVGVTTPTCNHS